MNTATPQDTGPETITFLKATLKYHNHQSLKRLPRSSSQQSTNIIYLEYLHCKHYSIISTVNFHKSNQAICSFY